MAGKTRPSLMAKTLTNVALSNLSLTDKKCIEEVFKKFEVLTSADAVEVKHGKWINGRYNDWKDNVYEEMCSVCGRYSQEYGRGYCPNCGAKMDGGKEE